MENRTVHRYHQNWWIGKILYLFEIPANSFVNSLWFYLLNHWMYVLPSSVVMPDQASFIYEIRRLGNDWNGFSLFLIMTCVNSLLCCPCIWRHEVEDWVVSRCLSLRLEEWVDIIPPYILCLFTKSELRHNQFRKVKPMKTLI